MPSGGFSLDSHALSDEAMAPTACVTCTAVGWSLFWKGCCYGQFSLTPQIHLSIFTDTGDSGAGFVDDGTDRGTARLAGFEHH